MNTLQTAQRLIAAAGGGIVAGIGVGIAEPGYGTGESVWVIGNWNNKRTRRNGMGDPPLTKEESRPERLAVALARLAVEVLPSNEWAACHACGKAVRTQPDSYYWTPYFVEDSDGITCVDCCITGDDSPLDGYIGNPTRAVPQSISENQLVEWGWVRMNRVYHNSVDGGMDESPAEVYELLKNGPYQVLFRVHSVSKDYFEFTVWTREAES